MTKVYLLLANALLLCQALPKLYLVEMAGEGEKEKHREQGEQEGRGNLGEYGTRSPIITHLEQDEPVGYEQPEDQSGLREYMEGDYQESGGCEIDVESLEKPEKKVPPLLVQEGALLLPTGEEKKRKVIVEEGKSLQLVCHASEGHENFLEAKSHPDWKDKTGSVEISCKGGKFQDSAKNEEVEKVSCSQAQEPLLVKTEEKCSEVGVDAKPGGKMSKVVIGWKVGDTMIEQISLCVDEANFGTVWAHHTVHGANIALQDKGGRPKFELDTQDQNRFYPWAASKSTLEDLYSKKEALKSLTEQLGGESEVEGEKIISTSKSGKGSQDYLAKGHLAPDAAFIWQAEAEATYFYMNVAPQFQSFNADNWKDLEAGVREVAKKVGHDLTVTTGTHEILEYPDKSKANIPMFLGTKSGEQVPVPKYYWKVVEDPESKTAVAFIGLNDPHANKPPEEFCTNRCSELTGWGTEGWGITELNSGYLYCCDVQEARSAIKSIPEINSSGGLFKGDK